MRKKYLKGIVAGMMVGVVLINGVQRVDAGVPKRDKTIKREIYDCIQARNYAIKYSGDSEYKSYAKGWSAQYNNAYPSFSGDCTNFVSQCANAGGIGEVTGDDPVKYDDKTIYDEELWYCKKNNKGVYSATSSWVNCDDFVNYMEDEKHIKISNGCKYDDIIKKAQIGDVIQVCVLGDVKHSMFVVGKHDDKVYIAAHTNDHACQDFKIQDKYWNNTISKYVTTYNLIRLSHFK